MNLFGQFKRITSEWLDTCLVCKGGTYPAQLVYQELADMACERIKDAINRTHIGERPIKVLLDSYNPMGSSRHVISARPKRGDGRPILASVTSIGSFWIAIGRPSFAAWLSLIRRCGPM